MDGLAPVATGRPALRTAAWSVAAVLGAGIALAGLQAGISSSRLLALLLLAPVVEELVFRGGLQQLLQSWLPAAEAVAGTSLVFALAHVLMLGQLQAALVVLPSLLIGGVYARSGRLGDAVALHAAMNAAWLGLGLWHGAPGLTV